MRSLRDVGFNSLLVDIDGSPSNNIIVGFGNRAVDEANERVRGAFSNSGLQMPQEYTTIDLAIAAAIVLAADNRIGSDGKRMLRESSPDEAVLGEMGRDGSIRPVRGVLGKIQAGRRLGITTFFIPAGNLQQAGLVLEIVLFTMTNLQQLCNFISVGLVIEHIKTSPGITRPENTPNYEFGLRDVVG